MALLIEDVDQMKTALLNGEFARTIEDSLRKKYVLLSRGALTVWGGAAACVLAIVGVGTVNAAADAAKSASKTEAATIALKEIQDANSRCKSLASECELVAMQLKSKLESASPRLDAVEQGLKLHSREFTVLAFAINNAFESITQPDPSGQNQPMNAQQLAEFLRVQRDYVRPYLSAATGRSPLPAMPIDLGQGK